MRILVFFRRQSEKTSFWLCLLTHLIIFNLRTNASLFLFPCLWHGVYWPPFRTPRPVDKQNNMAKSFQHSLYSSLHHGEHSQWVHSYRNMSSIFFLLSLRVFLPLLFFATNYKIPLPLLPSPLLQLLIHLFYSFQQIRRCLPAWLSLLPSNSQSPMQFFLRLWMTPILTWISLFWQMLQKCTQR